jgi:DNA processing protein
MTGGAEKTLERLLDGDEAPYDVEAYGDLRERAERTLLHTERVGARVIIPEDDEWPTRLDDLADTGNGESGQHVPPLCLWVCGVGSLAELLDRSVAVVGAREASTYGTHVAAELGDGLARPGWTVVSGGAYGIDAAAHRGALGAEGGATVAVLGSGIDQACPSSHANLFARIQERGLLVSEWPPAAKGMSFRFAHSRRLITAIACGTVMVEAAADSTGLRTLDHALRLGRPAMAVPGQVISPLSAGCHAVLREHTAVRLVTDAADVVSEVERWRSATRQPERAKMSASVVLP